MMIIVWILLLALSLSILAFGWALTVIEQTEKEMGVVNKRIKEMERIINED